VEDLYKLLMQASCGAEHAAIDRESARLRLEQELASLVNGPVEPLLDPIAPAGVYVRVHLRPFVALNLNPEFLVKSFVNTIENPSQSRNGYSGFVEVAAGLCREGLLPFVEPETTSYLEGMLAAGLPAVHHSEAYVESFHPAYRVVGSQFLPRDWLPAD
jgi:hypothetical protein